MDSIYWIIIVALLLLAAFDLINGVANDAVNFLNSAIGSKAAPVRVILTVASIGVLVGACFSGGMMEVARNGIFHPNMFSYHEVMLLFLGVMISEVIHSAFPRPPPFPWCSAFWAPPWRRPCSRFPSFT